jgi:hypothetical protein
MKYIDALKKYNEGKDKWCSPRKGSEDYLKIRKLMNETAASPKKAVSASAASAATMISDASAKKTSSRTKVYKNATIIQRFLKNKLILTKNNLDTRVQRYKLIKERLDKITDTDCLTKKMFGKNNGYTLNGLVNLEKKMGSDSANGVIYLSSMPHLLGSYPIASKLMEITEENEFETRLNKWITNNLIITKKSKHFVMMYKNTKCVATNKLAAIERLVNYNELCDGDISSLMKTDVRNDETLMINMAYQVLIAIATFQNRVGYCHNDAHHGNFLYQINKDYKETDRGYYHYVYNGLNFYIKCCKYNMCIFDFGLSIPTQDVNNTEIATDYLKIIVGFISRKNGGFINSAMDKQVSANMVEIMSKLKAISTLLIAKNIDDMFGEIIEDVFKVFRTDTQIFRTTKPTKVLNKIPFVINKVSEDPTDWE